MSTARKRSIRGNVHVKTYTVIKDAIERGLLYGKNHAHKHTDNPTWDSILDHQLEAAMCELCEVLNFDEHQS